MQGFLESGIRSSTYSLLSYLIAYSNSYGQAQCQEILQDFSCRGTIDHKANSTDQGGVESWSQQCRQPQDKIAVSTEICAHACGLGSRVCYQKIGEIILIGIRIIPDDVFKHKRKTVTFVDSFKNRHMNYLKIHTFTDHMCRGPQVPALKFSPFSLSLEYTLWYQK